MLTNQKAYDIITQLCDERRKKPGVRQTLYLVN